MRRGLMPKQKHAGIHVPTILPVLGREHFKQKDWAAEGWKGRAGRTDNPQGGRIVACVVRLSQGANYTALVGPKWEVGSKLCLTLEAFSRPLIKVVAVGKENDRGAELFKEEQLPLELLHFANISSLPRKRMSRIWWWSWGDWYAPSPSLNFY